jgi:hypothetical protein
MQNAPSVDYPVGRFAWIAWLGFVFSLCSIMALTVSFWAGLFEAWSAACLFVIWVVLTLYAVIILRHQQIKNWLCWDGHEWQVQTMRSRPKAPPAVTAMLVPSARLNPHLNDLPSHDGYAISVHLDFQQYLLVSLFNPNALRQWFWVSKRTYTERWHGFRCAVYSRSE